MSSSSPSPVPPARVAAVLAALRGALPSLPAGGGGVVARVVVVPGALASLVSYSGVVLVPSAWRLVCQVSGAGGWLLLAPAVPPVSQPSLF